MANKIYIIQSALSSDGIGYASNIKTHDIRLQGQTVEKVLVDYFKKFTELYSLTSTFDKELIEGEIYETISSTIGDINDRISMIQQSADKIELLVKSMDGSSELQITDKLIQAISSNIKITAENIDLNGYVSNRKVIDENGIEQTIPGNWYINNDGEAGYQSLSVEQDISCDALSVNEISNPKYPTSLSGNMDLYVDPINGSDDAELEDESTFRTLQGILNVMPKNLNGGVVKIHIKGECEGNVSFTFFTGGRIFIFFGRNKCKGYLRFYACNSDIKLYGGAEQSSTDRGTIAPNVLYQDDDGYSSSVFVQKCPFFTMHYMDVYGSSTNTQSYAIKCMDFSNARIYDVNFYDIYNGASVTSLSNLYAIRTNGKARNIGWTAISGGMIRLGGGANMGGTTNDYSESNGDVITGTLRKMLQANMTSTDTPVKDPSDNTFDKNNNTNINPSNPGNNTSTTNKTTKTVTYVSTGADTYRSSVYNNWKKDGTVRQGDWGYGDCNGCWFFGSQFANMKGKDVTSIKVTIKRQTGGYQASHPFVLKMHKYGSRPSIASGSKPSYLSGWSKEVSVAVGKSLTFTISDAAVINAIKNGTMKGFGIQDSYNKARYGVLSGAMTIVVTYRE